jgi:hypothetical protein
MYDPDSETEYDCNQMLDVQEVYRELMTACLESEADPIDVLVALTLVLRDLRPRSPRLAERDHPLSHAHWAPSSAGCCRPPPGRPPATHSHNLTQDERFWINELATLSVFFRHCRA